MEEANILNFDVYIYGPSLFSIENGMRYTQIIETHIFSPSGASPVLNYKLNSFTDKKIVYSVSVDGETFKTPSDFSKAMVSGINSIVENRKVAESGTGPQKDGSEAVIIKLKYSTDLKYLGGMVIKARSLNERAELEEKKQQLIDELEEAKRLNYSWSIPHIQEELQNVNDQLEVIQRLELSNSYSASEKELMNKALETEEQKEEKSEQPTPTATQPQVIAPSTIVPASVEKNVLSLSKESSTKESSLIQSILNNISTSESSKLESTKEGAEKTNSKQLETQIIKTMVTSIPNLLERELQKQASSIISSVSSAEDTVKNIVASAIPTSGLSGLLSTTFNSEANTSTQSDTLKSQENIISSINDNIKILQSSIDTISSDIVNKTSEIASMLNISYDSNNKIATSDTSTSTSSLIDSSITSNQFTDSSLESIGSKLFQSIEKSNLFSNIQDKVVGIESLSQTMPNVSQIVTDIGNTIKSAVTSITSTDKTMTEMPAPIMNVSNTSTKSSVTDGNKTDSALQNQNVQNVIGGQMPMPSVVSLSQNTIDNLASAIIKNMSIAPFLNSGR
jgi:hypothetical protein